MNRFVQTSLQNSPSGEEISEVNVEVIPYSSSAALSLALWEQEHQHQHQQQQPHQQWKQDEERIFKTKNQSTTKERSFGNANAEHKKWPERVHPNSSRGKSWNAYSVNDYENVRTKSSSSSKLFFWKKRKPKNTTTSYFGDDDYQNFGSDDSDDNDDGEASDYDESSIGNESETKEENIETASTKSHAIVETSRSTLISQVLTPPQEEEDKFNETKQRSYESDDSTSSLEEILGKPNFTTIQSNKHTRKKEESSERHENRDIPVEEEVVRQPQTASRRRSSTKFPSFSRMFRGKHNAKNIETRLSEVEQTQITMNERSFQNNSHKINKNPNNDIISNERKPETENGDSCSNNDEVFEVKPEAIILDLMDMSENLHCDDDGPDDRYMNTEEEDWLNANSPILQSYHPEEYCLNNTDTENQPKYEESTLIKPSTSSSTSSSSSSSSPLSKSDNPEARQQQIKDYESLNNACIMETPNAPDLEQKLKELRRWKNARRNFYRKMGSDGVYYDQDCVQDFSNATGELISNAYEAMKLAMQAEEPYPTIRRNSTKTTKVMSNRLEEDSIGSSACLNSVSSTFLKPDVTTVSAKEVDMSGLSMDDSFSSKNPDIVKDVIHQDQMQNNIVNKRPNTVGTENKSNEISVTNEYSTSSFISYCIEDGFTDVELTIKESEKTLHTVKEEDEYHQK